MKTLKPLFYLFILSLNISFSQNIVEDLTCEQTFQLIQKYSGDVNFIIIDLSPQKLFATGHIENALYFDVFSEQFASWVNCLDKEKVYLIYCTSGHRSKIGKEKMMNMGFKNLYHLYEGIKKWKELGYPVIKEPSEVSEVEKVLNNVFGWAIEKDFDLFYNSILNDSNFISVTPYDRVKFGFEEVRKDSAFWGSPDFKAV
ncbi:MAG: rhodanese-like domain-containing protein, partial [Ignavibacteriales bacterium]|nr:rhodanese-like domain-containing protein [Ignavibacteriales bacterium]